MLRVVQAVSGEIVLEKLVDIVLRTAIEHAGADRGVLIVPRGDELWIQAEGRTSGGAVDVRIREIPISSATVPESVVRYTARAKESVQLADASTRGGFENDDYVRREHVISVLCLPLLRQGQVMALLYLENNLAAGVFTPARMAVLNVLVSQAAMSLENTRLYRDLAERESRIRRLVDANIVGILIWDLEGRILEANEAFLAMVGYDRTDLAAGRLSWTDLTPPEWRDRDERLTHELRESGSLQPFEKEYFRKDGSRVPVLVGVASFEGKVDEGVAFVVDLTERKRAEQALLERELEARLVIGAIPGFIAVMSREGEIEFVNQPLLAYFGRTLEDMKGWITSDAVHPDELPRLVSLWTRAMETGEPYEMESRLRRADGAYRWFYSHAMPLRDGDGRVVRWYVLMTDIDDRKRAEEALRESEREARLIVNSIPGFIAVLTPANDVEVVNDQLVEYCGQPLDALRRWRTGETVHSEDLPRVVELSRQGIASGDAFGYEARIRRFDGVYRWFQVRHLPLRDTRGQVVRWYALLSDIDDRKRAEAEVREAYTELAHVARVTTMGELTASIAHEVKQPITAAVTSAQTALRWLEARPPELGEVRVALSRIVRAGKQAGDVIGRIRALVTKAPARKDSVEINDVIREVVELTRGEAAKNGVWVRTDLAEGLPLVQGDRVQLQQVILNLIINGIEAMTGRARQRESCGSAPGETMRGACASRWQIPVRDWRKGRRSRCSRPSTPPSRAVWGWGSRSAARSSKPTTDDCGRARTSRAAPSFSSLCLSRR